MLNRAALFIRTKSPYILGFCVIEAMLYWFNGPTGNFTTGFPALFVIWFYYSWMSRN